MTTNPMPGGRRRIDRVLAPDFLDGLAELPLERVRGMRREAEQEEADLSYLRRMLQGRMDIVRAELSRRGGEDDRHVVEHLADVLADPDHQDRGLGRFLTVQPSRVDEHKRRIEQVIADAGASDVEARDDAQLRDALQQLQDYLDDVSENRRRVQQVMDTLTAEVGRRYKDGTAHVEDVLPHN
jgi:GNAT superfamily N-acetyltransferase